VLQPLANALDQLEDYGVVHVDRTQVRLFLVQQGRIEETTHQIMHGKRTRHIKSTGREHADSSDHNQRRADNQIHANLNEAIEHVKEFVNTHQLDRLILAGSIETVAELRRLLQGRIHAAVIGETPLKMDASVAQVLGAAQPLANAYESNSEKAKVDNVVTSAAKTEKAVIGLEDTLQALNSDRVWELIACADFRATGYECTECDALFATEPPRCSHCNSTLRAVHTIANRAIESALRKQAKVEIVTGDASASLEAAGGIGAFLKTRTKAVIAS